MHIENPSLLNFNVVNLPLCAVEFISDSTFVILQEQRAGEHVFFVPNSMPLTHYLRLIPRALLLLLLCSSPISCFGNPWDDCRSPHRCGKFNYSYPFGPIGTGCGYPDFQLHCVSDDNLMLQIGGEEYHILKASFLANNAESHLISIVKDSLFLDKCSSPGNYTQPLLYGPSFDMASEYTNLTFWRECDPSFKTGVVEFSGCDDWLYSFDPVIYSNGTRFCKTHFQLPIKKDHDPQLSPTFLTDGFEILWHVDPSRNLRCGPCEKSNGSCGYNPWDSTSFLCYCPDGTSHQDKCLADGRFPDPSRNLRCGPCKKSNGRCVYNPSDSTSFLCYCPDGTSHPDKCLADGSRNQKAIIIGCSIGGVVLTAAVVILFLKFYGKRRKTFSRGIASGDMEAAILPRRQLSNLPIFSYEELRQATNCFHEENELGDGGFGSVYLGKLSDGRTVAVKRLYQDNSRRLEQFLNEVHIFSTLNHPRVVRLYGCTSADSPELLLVYEFVSNGTLADHLHGDRRDPRGLPWDARLNIAIQTAEALDFLHSVDPPIFHRDVKSTNILLDENLNVKVADFGLCRLVPVNASHVTTAPQGTPGYVDPEYHQCYQLTEKSDVYSFGVVLMEIISAKLAVDINRNRKEISLANMAKSKIQEGALNELVDPQLGIEMNHEMKVTVSAVAELALRCLASERDYRPHMKEVVAQLREIKQSWDTSTGPGDQQWGSFSNTKESLSPISVQDKWSSKSSTPNASA